MTENTTSTDRFSLGFDERSTVSVHFEVETTRVAQVVTGSVPSPQRRRRHSTVDALSAIDDYKTCTCIHVRNIFIHPSV